MILHANKLQFESLHRKKTLGELIPPGAAGHLGAGERLGKLHQHGAARFPLGRIHRDPRSTGTPSHPFTIFAVRME